MRSQRFHHDADAALFGLGCQALQTLREAGGGIGASDARRQPGAVWRSPAP
jgi:hypothetical protein